MNQEFQTCRNASTNSEFHHFIFVVLVTLVFGLSIHSAHAESIPGYTRTIPPESPKDRELRHARVAERRAGTVLICHRGGSTLATENTLEAYAAAMDYGADGCEIDLRKTTDGVLVLFHDDVLDRLSDGFGQI